MSKIIDFKLKKAKDLHGLESPCESCKKQPECRNTCEKASAWWGQFAAEFKRRSTG